VQHGNPVGHPNEWQAAALGKRIEQGPGPDVLVDIDAHSREYSTKSIDFLLMRERIVEN
jgi:hypothetical protein